MKLTQLQIQNLYTFTKQHYVEYYDLQTELVDHLANDIELILEETPYLTFEQARNQSFKKFGVFGFTDVLGERYKTMGKRYRSYLWNELKLWFEFPQFLITLSIFIGFYTALKITTSFYVFVGILVIIGAWAFYKGILLKREVKRREKRSNKKWLMESIIFQQAMGGGGVFLANIINFHILYDLVFINNITIIMTSLILTFVTLIAYICYSLFPDRAEDLLLKTYPEYKLI